MADRIQLLEQKVAQLTNLLNSLLTDAKTNDELPLATSLDLLAKFRGYFAAESKIYTAQQMINFILTQTGNNKFIATNGSNLDGEYLTISDNWQWNIQGNFYFNPADVIVHIPFAAMGKSRIDLVVANKSNTFVVVSGSETTGTPVSPTIPSPSDDTLLAYFITVTDDTIAIPPDPSIGKYLGTYPTQSDFEGARGIDSAQYGSFAFIMNTGILKLALYNGAVYVYYNLLPTLDDVTNNGDTTENDITIGTFLNFFAGGNINDDGGQMSFNHQFGFAFFTGSSQLGLASDGTLQLQVDNIVLNGESAFNGTVTVDGKLFTIRKGLIINIE